MAHIEIPEGRVGTARCAVVTIIPEELEPARRLLGAMDRIPATQYFVKPSGGDLYDVVVVQAADRTNGPAQEVTRNVIEDFRPGYLFLVGIAGGVMDGVVPRDGVELGDVVVVDYVDYSEFRKLAKGKSASRRIPYDHPSHALRTKFTQPISVEGVWTSLLKVARPDGVVKRPTARIGNLVAGEKLFGDPKNKYQAAIIREFDKAVAIDMESYGFARAVFESRWSIHYNPQCAIVRGISDISNAAENDETRIKWKHYAAEAAVAFVTKAVQEILAVR